MPDSPITPANCVDGKVLLGVLAQVKGGDFTARMPLEWTGVAGKVADSLNEVIISNQAWSRSWPGSVEWSVGRASFHSGRCWGV